MIPIKRDSVTSSVLFFTSMFNDTTRVILHMSDSRTRRLQVCGMQGMRQSGLTEPLIFVMWPNGGYYIENVPKTAVTILCGLCDNSKAVT